MASIRPQSGLDQAPIWPRSASDLDPIWPQCPIRPRPGPDPTQTTDAHTRPGAQGNLPEVVRDHKWDIFGAEDDENVDGDILGEVRTPHLLGLISSDGRGVDPVISCD